MNLKKYLPFENLTLETNLNATEVHARLEANIETKTPWIINGYPHQFPKPYLGQITANTFKFERLINYSNRYLPVIRGDISPGLGKTHLVISMKLKGFVFYNLIFWLCISTLGLLTALIIMFTRFKYPLEYGVPPMIYIPLSLIVYICLVPSFLFKRESKKAKAFLASLLGGQYI